MAFEVGHTINNGRAKSRHIYDGLMREVMQNPEKLKDALSSVLDKAATGDLDALDWIACRLEGKPAQAVTLDTDGANVQFTSIQMLVVKHDPAPKPLNSLDNTVIEHTNDV